MPRAAFSLRVAETVYPGVSPRYALEFETALEVPSNGRYRLGFSVEGAYAELSWQEEQRGGTSGEMSSEAHGEGRRFVSSWKDFGGDVSLRFRVKRTGVGPMRARVLWERAYDATGGFPMEPVPSWATVVPPGFDGPELDPLSVETRVLVERKGCTNCHEPGNVLNAVHDRSAPSLTNIGTRASVEWMRRWLQSPASLRSGADMPDLFHEPDEYDLESLLHYLAAQKDGNLEMQEVPFDLDDSPAIAEGKQLYHAIGCVACHGALASPAEVLGDEYLPSEVHATEVPAPFGDLVGKWNPVALAAFLSDPASVYPDDRMPGFALDADEAVALASYLILEFGGSYSKIEPKPNRVAHGKEIVTKKGCLNCHPFPISDVPGDSRLPATDTPLQELKYDNPEGCLIPGDTTSPCFALSEAERTRLRSFLANIAAIPKVPSPSDEVHRTLEFMNCRACHAIDGRGGVAKELDLFFQPADERVDLGDEGRLPPDLSDVGWRLTTHWLREVLAGAGRSRPYLAARMPDYASQRVHALPELFAREQGILPDTDIEEPQVCDELVLAGREMTGRTAFGCFACHVYDDYPPTGSPGVAIDRFAERLRFEWFRPFMSNPQRFRPGGRMPDFAIGGKSQFKRFMEGDLDRQIDAMWAYFSLGEHLPPPDELASPGGYQLFVGSRPLVHRGFLEKVGSRGIAVGLANGLNYSFDADEGRLVEVWGGSFLNASGSWAGRGGSVLGGRGEVLWEALAGPGVCLGLPSEDGRFRGYRLDAQGYPTFHYQRNGFDIEEKVTLRAGPRTRLQRAFRIDTRGESLTVGFRARTAEARLRWRTDGGAWHDSNHTGTEAFEGFSVEVKDVQTIEAELELTL